MKKLRCALHPLGEATLLGYKVDGYDLETQCVYEFQGCFWHGCEVCFPNRCEMNPVSRKTMQLLFDETEFKLQKLKGRFKVVSIWEHDFDKSFPKDELPDFSHLLEPINPRDAMHGGRCGPLTLYKVVKPGEKIRYFDFNSLYPSCQLEEFPIGHPEIITSDFAENPTEAYYGMIKCRIHPPGNLYQGVLPVHVDSKLMFPLCMRCARERCQKMCEHTKEDRCLVGLWTTLELSLAVQKGYTIEQLFEVWHYKSRSNKLFRSYIDTFAKIKQEASGWPEGVETEAQKRGFVDSYRERTGRCLEKSKVQKNPGLRGLSKLMLNSLWGKLGQRAGRPTTVFLTDPVEFWNLHNRGNAEISFFHLLQTESEKEGMLMVVYNTVKEFVAEGNHQSIVVAAWTTSRARVKLYKECAKLLPEQRLYTDTDSIIWTEKDGWPKLELGEGMGALASELKADDYITEFVSVAPKSYAYNTKLGEGCCKFKGIRNNHATGKIVNLEAMKSLLQESGLKINVPDPQITRKRAEFSLRTDESRQKTIRLVFTKRIRSEDISLPYGFTTYDLV